VLSKNDYLSRGMMESLDEQKQDSVQNWITYLLHTGAILQKDYVLKISQMMRIVAAHESAIFLGRGANFIFRSVKEGLRVYLTAPFAARLQNMAASKNLSLAAAEKLVHDKDRERNEFFNHYFGQELQSGDAYDVAFNTATLSTATICKTIGNLLQERSAP
jgi:cytidylate kinase